jgi:DNA (cytosine-5)-methyltransferase 1
METAAFCEIDPYCRKVLSKHWPGVPIYEDIRAIPRIGGIDLICGGFPCQPFSVAGKQLGAKDDRHLWPAMFETIKRERPSWVIGENVAGLIRLGLDQVLSDLESAGYAARTFVIPAVAVNAPHRRDRLWIVANAPELQRNGGTFYGEHAQGEIPELGNRGGAENVAHAQCDGFPAAQVRGSPTETVFKEPNGENQSLNLKGASGLPGTQQNVADASRSNVEGLRRTVRIQTERSSISSPGWWDAEPNVGRVAHGIPKRVDRLRCLGNAIVPQIAERIGRAIMAVSRGKS